MSATLDRDRLAADSRSHVATPTQCTGPGQFRRLPLPLPWSPVVHQLPIHLSVSVCPPLFAAGRSRQPAPRSELLSVLIRNCSPTQKRPLPERSGGFCSAPSSGSPAKTELSAVRARRGIEETATAGCPAATRPTWSVWCHV